jgi:hypothetical protein
MMARFLGAVVCGALVAGAAGAASAAELKCAYLKDIALTHASVTTITTESLGDTARSCRINVISKPTKGEELRVEVWIPVGPAWNGRYRQIAGVGGDPRGLLRANASAGFAGAVVDRTRGATDPVAAEKETGEIARTLIAALKGRPPAADPPPPPPPPKPAPRRRTHH